MARRSLTELGILVVIIGFHVALFTPTVGHRFVWDDVHEIEHNPVFEQPIGDGLWSTQTERTDPTLTELTELELAYDSYRPLLFVSYWVDLRLWGRGAAPLHAVNVALGALGILFAYLVARQLLQRAGDRSPVPALVTTAVFALHPLQVETIAYISARGDLLAGLFALVATYAALRGLTVTRARPAWVALAAAAFAASLLCKEAYLALPVAIAALAWVGAGDAGPGRARWWLPAVLGGIAIGYLVLRAAIVTATTGGAIGDAALGLPGVWLEYLRIAVMPLDLSTERLYRASLAPIGWIVMVLAVAAAGYRWRTRPGPLAPAHQVALAGLGWMLLLLAPSAIAVISTGVAADRYGYLPLFGLGLALGQLAHGPARLRRLILGVGIAWAALCIFVGIRQVPVWQDNRTLYTHAAVMAPASSMAHYRLAYLDVQAGNWAAAIPRLEHAVALDGRNVRALNNLGVGFMRQRDFAGAEVALARAIAANPAHFRAWFNLGVARVALGNRTDGCANIARAVELNPHYQAALAELERTCK